MNPGLTRFRFDSPVTVGHLRDMGRLAFCMWLHKQVSCLWGCTPACTTLGYLCERTIDPADVGAMWTHLHSQLWAWKGPLADLGKAEISRRADLPIWDASQYSIGDDSQLGLGRLDIRAAS